jgi:hypothetical protein
MTDAAVAVTQSAVERFTEQYLRSRGCDIEIYEDRWEIAVPEGTDTTLGHGNLTLVLGEVPEETDAAESLHPESTVFQQILSEASERCAIGKLSIETADTSLEIPTWVQEGDVTVADAQFTPYYDRTAVVCLFRVGIETVSEYQKEYLQAIALDARSGDALPKLEQLFLQSTSIEENSTTSTHSDLGESDVRSLLDTARGQLIDRIQPMVDEIHEDASRAADAEVEEYRQMQQQRISELEEEYSTLSLKINELSEAINSAEQGERVQALKERKELTSEYDEIDVKLSDLRERRDKGFPEKQQEIRERHALDVRVTPLTVTQVDYERGEAILTLADGAVERSLTFGYGIGIGATEDVCCDGCNQVFGGMKLLKSIQEGLRCEDCAIR